MYENIQIQIYMWILNIKKCYFVERYNQKNKKHKVSYDENLIQKILEKLEKIANQFILEHQEHFTESNVNNV